MKKPEKTIILLTLFTILTLISIITVYVVHQNSTQGTKTNTLRTYTSTAVYYYTATLEPNTIYNNKTTLKPNEGTLHKNHETNQHKPHVHVPSNPTHRNHNNL